MNKFAVIFPGQGSQYVGMGMRLYEESLLARQLFDAANEIVGFDLLARNSTSHNLYDTTFAQPAIFALSVIAYRVFTEHFHKVPQFFAGHSLGEYSALVCSEALDFFEGLKLVKSRAKLMSGNLNEGQAGMSAIENISLSSVEEVITKFKNVYISNINSVKQIVISGLAYSVEQAAKELERLGAQIKLLKLNLPFHTPLLKATIPEFEKTLENICFNFPRVPVISNVTAKPYESVDEIRRLLAVQITSLVRWQETMQFLVEQVCDRVIEIGPKRSLKRFFNDSFPAVKCQSIEFNFEELPSWFKNSLPQSSSNLIVKALAVIATTKNKQAFQLEHRLRIQALYSQLKRWKEEEKGSLEEVNRVLEEVLDLKGFSSQEIDEYLIQDSQDVQLFCFPYAGGSASLFKDWKRLLPSFIEVIPVEYPGRGALTYLPPAQRLDLLLDELEKQIRSKISSKFGFFGHSLGAIVVYELAQRFKNKYGLAPLVLCLSACPAPNRLGSLAEMKTLNDKEFMASVKALNGTPDIIFEEKVFKDFFLPILRADFHLLDHYQPKEENSLPSSLLLFGGSEDQIVKQEDIQAWSAFTQNLAVFHEMKGDHFFIHNPSEMLKLISKELQLYSLNSEALI